MTTYNTLFGEATEREDEVYEKPKKVSPFIFLNAINDTKQDLIDDSPDLEKEYNAFLVNRGLSYHIDAIIDANEMNLNSHLPKKLQFGYLINTLRKRKRFSKWYKGNKDDADLKLIQHFYGYSRRKSEQALTLLTSDQLDSLRKIYNELPNG